KFADEGLDELRKHVDTVITIPNQKLLQVVGKNTTILDAFRKADDVLNQAVRGITDLITIPGLINVDFADVRTVMDEMGQAMMGASEASGDTRALDAATNAISSPLLDDVSIHGARGVLINITGGYDLALQEVDEAASVVRDMAHEDAIIVFGAVLDESMTDMVRVTVVATGIGDSAEVSLPQSDANKRTAATSAPMEAATPFGTAAPRPEPQMAPLQSVPQQQSQQQPQPNTPNEMGAPPHQDRPLMESQQNHPMAPPHGPMEQTPPVMAQQPSSPSAPHHPHQQQAEPAYESRAERPRRSAQRRPVDLEDFSKTLEQINNEDNLDVPTFLRRQMD
ncbi:MAG: cell division protein FtsZ, partial [Magnetococcales bacterium]|nr:cell division protein FtsZ [Magnetococcales bacterium]